MKPTKEMFDSARELHVGRVQAYKRGELNDAQFRPIRLSYGLYYQLDHTSYMQRIKIPAGLMTADQMDVLAAITDDYGRGVTHVTTRQDVQIHWVPLEKTGEMYERLERVGITTRGACSDSVRNVTACPFAGVSPDAPFDVTPHAMAIHDWFLFNPLNLTLPRKFKIAVESCPLDCAQGTINDIGLYATTKGGKPGFSVWAGGGLGAAPFLAVKVLDFVPADDVLIACEAIVRIQHRSGERKLRHKARLKFLVKKVGTERFRQMVASECERVAAERGTTLREEVLAAVSAHRSPRPGQATDPVAARAGYEAWARTNVRAQRDASHVSAVVALPLGDVTADELRALARLARQYGDGTTRATNDQNLVFQSVHRSALPAFHAELVHLGLADGGAMHLTDVVTCPGSDYCSLAVTRSMGVGDRIRSHLSEAGFDGTGLGQFHVKISGCPNSCGQHHIADVGLTGMMVKDEHGIELPHYSLLVGGAVGEGKTFIGRRLFGRFAENDAPRAIVALARYYGEQRQPDERFAEFVARVGTDVLDRVAQEAVGGAIR
ncbi:nitrite/sulfite reductase [Candidatus Binatia bacterium]|jgi:sulfite reductase beta subunit-like hemoprotein|nr:nitrite/sulfite reductase [Candidatus Binatia bacterium]